MRPTILAPGPVEEKSQEREVFLCINQLRDEANLCYHARFEHTTEASGGFETIWGPDDFDDDTAFSVEAKFTARATAGGAARATYIIAGLFYREGGGALTQEGATQTLLSIESVAAFDVGFLVSGNSMVALVRDDGARTVDWSVEVFVRRVG